MDEQRNTNTMMDDDVAGHALPALGAVLTGALAKDYVAYPVCFYPAWIGSGDAVKAGDDCHDRYVPLPPACGSGRAGRTSAILDLSDETRFDRARPNRPI